MKLKALAKEKEPNPTFIKLRQNGRIHMWIFLIDILNYGG